MGKNRTTGGPTLSICFIVKNEEKRLPLAIESVSNVAAEIVVVDTGSTDRTVEIASQLSARVIEKSWVNDFSVARNHALDAATGDWILCMDADETLASGQNKKLRAALLSKADAWFVQLRSPVGADGRCFMHAFPRLFRNRPEYRFQGRVHEQIFPSLQAAGATVHYSDLMIEHSGYAVEQETARGKLERNLELLYLDLEENPEDALIHFHMGETHTLLKNLEGAVKSYRNAIRTGRLTTDHSAVAHQNLANALLKLGEMEEAIREAGKAMEADPLAAVTSIMIKGTAYFQMGDYERAIREAGRYLKKCGKAGKRRGAFLGFTPDPARALYLKGESLFRLGRLPESEREAERAIRKNREWAGGYRLMARITAVREDFNRTVECLEKVTAVEPDDTAAWRDLAHARAVSGDVGRALDAIDEAVNLSGNVELCSIQGHLRIMNGDLPGAIESYEQVLDLDPDCEQAHRRLAGLYYMTGKGTKARESLEKIGKPIQETDNTIGVS